MLSIQRLIQQIGDPLRAETVLLQHYAAKQQRRYQWDRRYAAMQFVLKWGPLFRRHVRGPLGQGPCL